MFSFGISVVIVSGVEAVIKTNKITTHMRESDKYKKTRMSLFV